MLNYFGIFFFFLVCLQNVDLHIIEKSKLEKVSLGCNLSYAAIGKIVLLLYIICSTDAVTLIIS